MNIPRKREEVDDVISNESVEDKFKSLEYALSENAISILLNKNNEEANLEQEKQNIEEIKPLVKSLEIMDIKEEKENNNDSESLDTFLDLKQNLIPITTSFLKNQGSLGKRVSFADQNNLIDRLADDFKMNLEKRPCSILKRSSYMN